MFYESQHSLTANTFKSAMGEDFSFPLHLHEAFELIAITEGEMEVTVERTAYTVSAGEAVLIFPDQLHSFVTKTHSKHILWIFSTGYVKAYTSVFRDLVPVCNKFRPAPALLESLERLNDADSLMKFKGVLYSLTAAFDEDAQYRERSREEDTLLLDIFEFVREHFAGDCSLRSLAASLSYHYVYLSRYFKDRTGLSFTDYVNRYRINESCYRLSNGADSVTAIALDCGFDSLRSFHRNFARQTGKTPVEYRASASVTKNE